MLVYYSTRLSSHHVLSLYPTSRNIRSSPSTSTALFRKPNPFFRVTENPSLLTVSTQKESNRQVFSRNTCLIYHTRGLRRFIDLGIPFRISPSCRSSLPFQTTLSPPCWTAGPLSGQLSLSLCFSFTAAAAATMCHHYRRKCQNPTLRLDECQSAGILQQGYQNCRPSKRVTPACEVLQPGLVARLFLCPLISPLQFFVKGLAERGH